MNHSLQHLVGTFQINEEKQRRLLTSIFAGGETEARIGRGA